MKANRIVTLLIIVLVSSSDLKAQGVWEFDLSRSDSKDILDHQVKSGEPISIVIINANPTWEYKAVMSTEVLPEPPLPSVTGPDESIAATCPDLDILVERVKNAPETEISSVLNELRLKLDEVSCDTTAPQVIFAHKVLAIGPIKLDQRPTLRLGERLSVTVTRYDGDGEPSRSWTNTYTTKRAGEWRSTFGYSFISLKGRQQFFLEPSENENEFTLKGSRDISEFDFHPTVFFVWHRNTPDESAFKTFQFGITGGLGLDIEEPTVFFGLAGTYRENFSVMAGVAARKLQVLNGQYSSGETIAEALTSEQLHVEVYKFRGFVSLALRRSAIPWGNDSN